MGLHLGTVVFHAFWLHFGICAPGPAQQFLFWRECAGGGRAKLSALWMGLLSSSVSGDIPFISGRDVYVAGNVSCGRQTVHNSALGAGDSGGAYAGVVSG